MSLFRRNGAPARSTAVEDLAPPIERYRVQQCAGCLRRLPPYVYMSNGKDYCIPCARQVARLMRVYPAGRRADDIKTLDL